MTAVRETESCSVTEFHDDVVPAGQPLIMRGLVRHWPVVHAADRSNSALFDYLRRFDAGHAVTTMLASQSSNGRFFYNEDLTGFNFRNSTAPLRSVFEILADASGDADRGVLAVQSVPTRAALPGFEQDNPFPLLGGAVEPRIWIGNAAIVAAHHDPSENIACVTAGHRRFTLFPPDQVANLYMGPFELTPAGATISMVDFDNPDLERFPRFSEAMGNAQVADLEPGDALYIPYLWWHHVRAFDKINMLVNFWWAPHSQNRGAPRDAFLHAMLALRALPENHRAAWRAMFEHYVFQNDTPLADHLPEDRRGMLGNLSRDDIRRIRESLSRTLARSN